MPSPKQFLLALFLCAAASSLYFSFRLGSACLSYFRLEKKGTAKVEQWEIIENGDRYALKAVYSLEIQEKSWQNSYVFKETLYLNEFAALAALKEKAKAPCTVVWYDAKNPQRAALEKRFPAGLLIRALLSLSVLIYFFCLYKRIRPVDLLT